MENKVMLVDDDDDIREMVEFAFTSKGIAIKCVPNGAACLEQLAQGFKGIILMDVMMPGMDGWKVIQEMKKKDLLKGNLICMFTSNEPHNPPVDDVRSYIIDYFKKPVETDRLVAVVQEYLSYIK